MPVCMVVMISILKTALHGLIIAVYSYGAKFFILLLTEQHHLIESITELMRLGVN